MPSALMIASGRLAGILSAVTALVIFLIPVIPVALTVIA
jgi:hypothetical protein